MRECVYLICSLCDNLLLLTCYQEKIKKKKKISDKQKEEEDYSNIRE